MAQSRRNKSLVVALYVNAALLFAILAVMLARSGSPSLTPSAFAAPLAQPIAGGGTIYLMPAQFSQSTFGAYLMDIDKQTLVAYQFYPGEKQLRFVAARKFSHDLRVTEFNTIPPVEDVKKMIEAQDAGIRGQQPDKIPLKAQDDPDKKQPITNSETRTMMAKMFYTLEETKSALGRGEDEIKQLAREGRLREFRDGPRLMFKADQVEQLKGELESGVDTVDLGVSDSGGMIGLVDTTGASGTSITLSDADTGHSSGAGMRLSDDSLASDLGLSGSLGGVPSPARTGGGTGIGMTSGSSGGSRGGGGINVFGAEDTASGERVDPSQQTVISPGFRQQMALEGVGSGSGLLDLTRESDDTSLGAVLDEITPSNRTGTGRSAAVPVGDSGLVSFEDEPVTTTRVSSAPQYVERADPMAPVFGGAALAGAVAVLFGVYVLVTNLAGNALPESLKTMSFLVVAGGGIVLAIIFGIVGMVLGKTAAR